MKNKLNFLVKISLERKIKTKWFKIANVLLAIALIALLNIDFIINSFGGDFDNKTKIYIIDETKKAFELFKNYMVQNPVNQSDESSYEIILSDKEKDEIIDLLKTNEEEKNNILIIFTPSVNIINVSMITNEYSNLMDMSIISSAINNTKTVLAIEEYNISEDQILALTTPANIERIILNEEKTVDENMEIIMTTVFPIIILPFFLLIILLVQMIGAEVNDEKTTRGMEIIISNVSPKVHFFSKCIAGNLFVLFQSFLIICYTLLGLLVRNIIGNGSNDMVSQVTSMLGDLFSTSFIESLSYIIPLMLILMFVTFIGYSLVAGILASMTTNTEDFQQMQTPIMLISLVGYYLSMMAGMFKGSILINILGYFPFVSAILSPSLLVLGEFSIFDVIISIIIMCLTVWLLIKYGLRIYKVGILNYSSDNLWKKMFKAIKEK